ncbi:MULTISPECIES: T9SS type A sorting domain-containing protein [unclassified Flavobacterium]|uniref:T9SS type A sorting domain-containing protein n=1 Tax=unclassified Flavobacterium TaxID=196869 RepID=UPI0012A80BEF|nr:MULTISPECIES: T9SS type A sorting domain-containing protein [unclassified Flavobacterium]MBF4483995.1 T9SS type A sorting domain-containing protein [Flavobacterium sp. CSZ]QGK75016.1 T9SS type A sorting domain-containing protein [Flavobacterium sp. SLB02]
MKKILKLSLVCAVLFTGMSTYAIDGNEDFNLHVLKNNGKVITFALNQVKKANLSIYDKEGTLIYSESASGKDGILRTFSLEEFPAGTYFLEVEDNVKKVRHEITITDNATVLSKKAISSVYKAGFSAKNTNVAVR